MFDSIKRAFHKHPVAVPAGAAVVAFTASRFLRPAGCAPGFGETALTVTGVVATAAAGLGAARGVAALFEGHAGPPPGELHANPSAPKYHFTPQALYSERLLWDTKPGMKARRYWDVYQFANGDYNTQTRCDYAAMMKAIYKDMTPAERKALRAEAPDPNELPHEFKGFWTRDYQGKSRPCVPSGIYMAEPAKSEYFAKLAREARGNPSPVRANPSGLSTPAKAVLGVAVVGGGVLALRGTAGAQSRPAPAGEVALGDARAASLPVGAVVGMPGLFHVRALPLVQYGPSDPELPAQHVRIVGPRLTSAAGQRGPREWMYPVEVMSTGRRGFAYIPYNATAPAA